MLEVKKYGARISGSISKKNWSFAFEKRLVHKIDTIGFADRKTNSGRRRTLIVSRACQVALNQENAPRRQEHAENVYAKLPQKLYPRRSEALRTSGLNS